MYSSSKLIEHFEYWFVVLSLFLFTGEPIKLLALSEASQSYQEGSNLLEQLTFLLIHVISLLLLIVHRKRVCSELVRRDKFILLMLLLIMLGIVSSALWSQYPGTTLRRSLALWGTTFFGIYFSTCHKFKQQLILLSQAYSIVIILSLVAGIFLPHYGIMSGTHAGAWRGIFLHKNGLGSSMVLSSVLFLILVIGDRRKRYLKAAFLFLSFLLLVLSTSINALLAFTILSSLFLLLLLVWLPYDWLVPILLGAILIVSLVALIFFSNLGFFLEILGKDLTFTGRTDIWPYVWEAINRKFWTGYGYEAFWRGFDSDAANIWYAVGWQPTHPHNGLLELLLIFGFIGTLLFLLIFIQLYLKSVVLVRVSNSVEYIWPVLFLTFTLFSNIGETNVLSYNSLSWVLYIMVAFTVIKPYQPYRLLNSSIFHDSY